MTVIETITLVSGGAVGGFLKWAWDAYSGRAARTADVRNKLENTANIIIDRLSKDNDKLINENSEWEAENKILKQDIKKLIEELTNYKKEIEELRRKVGQLEQAVFFKKSEL